MLTAHETRVLYVLKKQGGRAKLYDISRLMWRIASKDRAVALQSCEGLELISSAKTPPVAGKGGGGPGGLVYWLTDAGRQHVEDLIASGDMVDPATEPRAGKKRASA